MPASGKMLKNMQYAKNRELGIGDETGRLPPRVKAEEKMAKCTVCGQEIRVTKTNTEHKTHWENRHGTITFAACFPGIMDPTAAPVPTSTGSSSGGGSTATTSTAQQEKPKKKKEDLSFLDAALDPKSNSKKK